MKIGSEPDLIIGPPDNPYMHRWFIRKGHEEPSVYIHKFFRGDDERALHDHRSDNESIILEGEYVEWLAPKCDESVNSCGWDLERPEAHHRKAGDRVYRVAEQPHRIALINGGPVTTLWLKSGDRRDWGFWVPRGGQVGLGMLYEWLQYEIYRKEFGEFSQ